MKIPSCAPRDFDACLQKDNKQCRDITKFALLGMFLENNIKIPLDLFSLLFESINFHEWNEMVSDKYNLHQTYCSRTAFSQSAPFKVDFDVLPE